jgi:hypothetical protein
VYDWINNYRKYDGLDGIRNKREWMQVESQ